MDTNVKNIYTNLLTTNKIKNTTTLIRDWFEFKHSAAIFSYKVKNLALKTPRYVIMLHQYRSNK